MKLALGAHAKLNLELSVLGSTGDGQHLVRTVLQAVSLHDLIWAEPAARTELVGGTTDDLVLRAAAALEQRSQRNLPTLFGLEKRIPVGAGLGGGSSDAAAALRLMAQIHGLDLALEPVAAGLGADVPFFLSGGRQLGLDRGQILSPLGFEPGWYLLAWPGFGLSTAEVYAAWDEVGGEGTNHLLRAALTVEPRLLEFARELGAHWSMSGSGSAFYRAFKTPEEAEGERLRVERLAPWSGLYRGLGAWA
ncbi:MAG TPA: hypothetical protein VNI34_06935 [Candidatus Nitrosotalea sp.]|nr:hypothetical protein [Candidatus Nitrosotalea sp.]